jgi:hypothetical protein
MKAEASFIVRKFVNPIAAGNQKFWMSDRFLLKIKQLQVKEN